MRRIETQAARLALLLGLLFLCLGDRVAQAQPLVPRDVTRGPRLVSPTGLAGDADASSLSLNPAGLAALGGTSFVLGGTFFAEGAAATNGWAAFAAFPVRLLRTTFGLGLQSMYGPASWNALPGVHTAATDTYELLLGLGMGNRQRSFGLSYGHIFSGHPNLGGLDTFSLGLALRPSRYWAWGLSLRDLTAPGAGLWRIERSYEAELAIRPFGTSRFELVGGIHAANDNPDALVDGTGRLLIRWPAGVTLFASLAAIERPTFAIGAPQTGHEQRLTIGLTLDTERMGLTQGAVASLSNGSLGGVGVTARVSSERYPSLLASPVIYSLELAGKPSDRAFVKTLLWLDEVARRERGAGVLLKLRGYGLGSAQAEELREAVARLQKSGKRVFAFVEQPGLREYFAASACERVYMDPGGMVRFLGNPTRFFVKELFDKVGVRADVVRIGDYKSYPEMFTRTESSPPARKESETFQNDVYSHIGNALGQSRKLPLEKVRQLLQKPAVLAPEAKVERLVDDLVQSDELSERIAADLVGDHTPLAQMSKRRFVRLVDAPIAPPRSTSWRRPRIAIVHVEGDILPGKRQSLPLWGQTAGGEAIADALTSLAGDPAVSAVILRVASPGGAVAPSEQIARAVEKLRGKKPILVSMGNVAASGGYLVSARAEQIFALPTTLTGSIGIFFFKLDASALLAKLGIRTEAIKPSPHADMLDPYRGWTEEEQALAFQGISFHYNRFLGGVSKGRSMSMAAAHERGQGRIYSGLAALHEHLVDGLGGVLTALDVAKQRVGLAAEAEAEVVSLPEEPLFNLRALLPYAGNAAPAANPTQDSSDDDAAFSLGVLGRPLRALIEALPPSMVLLGEGLLARSEWAPEAN